jgi:hypothetical protein
LEEIPEDIALARRLFEEGRFSDFSKAVKAVKKWTGRWAQGYTLGLIGKGTYKAGKSARKPLSAAQKYIMKSWRKRAADFGQWERRVKRRTLKTLGRKYRTKGPVKSFKPTGAVAATFGTKFRKGKRPKTAAKYTKRHFDDYGMFERTHSLYFGFQTHGSQSRLCRIYGEALTRYLLSTVGIRPTSYDEILVPDLTGTAYELYESMYLVSKGIDDTTGADTNNNITVTLRGATFEAVAAAVGNFINTELDDGRFPHRVEFWKMIGSTNTIVSRVDDLEFGKIKIFAKQIIRIQNITPNDQSSTGAENHALDVTGTNPIQGKIYDFTSQPLLKSGLQEVHTDLDLLQAHGDTTTGYYVLPDSGSTASGGILSHPPPAGDLFKNCRKVANVRISAGANKYKTTLFKFEGNLVDFVKRFKHNHNERNLGGGISWFAFEQAFRAGFDQVKVAFNRELSMSAYYAVPKKKPMLRHYEQTDLGDDL